MKNIQFYVLDYRTRFCTGKRIWIIKTTFTDRGLQNYKKYTAKVEREEEQESIQELVPIVLSAGQINWFTIFQIFNGP